MSPRTLRHHEPQEHCPGPGAVTGPDGARFHSQEMATSLKATHRTMVLHEFCF